MLTFIKYYILLGLITTLIMIILCEFAEEREDDF